MAVATNYKAVLAQLADNNKKLVNTNEELAGTVKRLTNETKKLQQEINTLRQQGGGNTGGGGNATRGSGYSRHCPNCKWEVYHVPDNCYELEKNASRRPGVGVAACDEVGSLVVM